jgi:hypothetical protein
LFSCVKAELTRTVYREKQQTTGHSQVLQETVILHRIGKVGVEKESGQQEQKKRTRQPAITAIEPTISRAMTTESSMPGIPLLSIKPCVPSKP